MNVFDQKIAVKDETYNKYGWTNNIRIRYYFEKLHDLKAVINLIKEDNTTYFYFLKRCIVTGRTNLFKKFLSIKNMKLWQEDGLQCLVMYSIKYRKYSIFKYLIDNYEFTYINSYVKNEINKLYENEANRYLKAMYDIMIKNNILPTPSFSTLCNAFDFAKFNNDIFMLYMIYRTHEKFNLLNNNNVTNMSFPQYLKIFNYEYKPNKRYFN